LLRANGPALAAYGAPQVYGPGADPQIVTDDTARAILACIDAPNDLLERTAREVIEAAGVEFRLAKRTDAAVPPGETDRTPPNRKPQTPIGAERTPLRLPPEALRGRRSAAKAVVESWRPRI